MALQSDADFPTDLVFFKNVDALLRCPVCFDFLDISMMTKCSHNFCSLCIRKFLSYKRQCPICNMKMTEEDLRNNRLLDELVTNFQTARRQMSRANFDSPPISPKTPASVVKSTTPYRRGQNGNGSVLSTYFQKKPRTPVRKGAQREDSVAHRVQQGTTQNTQSCEANHSDPHSENPQLSVTVKQERTEEEDNGIEMAHSSLPSSDVKPIIKVECPVCSVGVSEQFINKHLDTCLTRDEKKESLRSNLGKTRRPMAKLVYNLLSVQELKRRLKECHLSVQGSRDQMIKRHQSFVYLYNSQCDSLNPKPAEEIAKEVEADEKMKNQLQKKSKPVMVFSKNKTEEEIDEMHSNYRKLHSSDFTRLIAQVRGRLETTGHAKHKVTANKPDAQVTQSADPVAESTSSPVIKIEEEDDGEQSARGTAFPCSPTCSDVSVSSSISDIFGPEPPTTPEVVRRTSARKRASREDDATLLRTSGKRCRKT